MYTTLCSVLEWLEDNLMPIEKQFQLRVVIPVYDHRLSFTALSGSVVKRRSPQSDVIMMKFHRPQLLQKEFRYQYLAAFLGKLKLWSKHPKRHSNVIEVAAVASSNKIVLSSEANFTRSLLVCF